MDFIVHTGKDAKAKKVEESWGSLLWLANEELSNVNNSTLGRVVIKKGCSNQRHAHMTCEEVLYLLKGRLEHTAGNESVIMEAGDTITVSAGIFHNAINIGDEDADMIVMYNSGKRDFVLEK